MGRKRVQITPNVSGNDPETFWAALNIWQFCIIDIMHHLAIFILVRIIDISPPALNFESFGSLRPPHPPAEPFGYPRPPHPRLNHNVSENQNLVYDSIGGYGGG